VESPDRELTVLRLLSRIGALQDEVHDFEKILKVVVRGLGELFEGTDVRLVMLGSRGARETRRWFPSPPDEGENRTLEEYLAGIHPATSAERLYVPVARRGRRWGVLVMRDPSAGLRSADVKVVKKVAKTTSRVGARIDRLRYLEVRSKIDRKVIRRLSPKDLFYQILHGLETLTEYDHSAAFLTYDENVLGDAAAALEIVAERLVWTKGLSRRIGQELAIGPAARSLLRSGAVMGFDRDGETWKDWEGRDVTELAAALDYNRSDEDRREQAILCAPLVSEDTVLGVLKIAATHPGTFGAWETELVKGFLPHTAVAVENLRVLEGMRLRLAKARDFQQSLLPATETRTDRASLAFVIKPWDELGGDFVDVHVDATGDVTFLIADVSGHGAEAAMLTAVVKSAFHDQQGGNPSPRSVIRRISRRIRYFEASLFITAICARYRPASGTLEYVNAGHPSGLVVTPQGRAIEITQTGLLLSPAFDSTWNVRQIRVPAGSRVFLHTDGITEAEGSAGEFGEERLRGMVRASTACGTELLEEVLTAVERHTDLGPQQDDLTLLTMRVE
jgi:GAF domain-containing protein